jgi:hypothetical protein
MRLAQTLRTAGIVIAIAFTLFLLWNVLIGPAILLLMRPS